MMTLQKAESDGLLLPLADDSATRALGRDLAGLLRAGDVVALYGDLGSGKTTLARALINALPDAAGRPVAEEVPSPTFTLVQVYERRPAPVWHFDLYRLTAPEEAYELGLEEALADAISLIEWPDRLGPLLPSPRLDLRLAFAQDPAGRQAALSGGGDWPARLAALSALWREPLAGHDRSGA